MKITCSISVLTRSELYAAGLLIASGLGLSTGFLSGYSGIIEMNTQRHAISQLLPRKASPHVTLPHPKQMLLIDARRQPCMSLEDCMEHAEGDVTRLPHYEIVSRTIRKWTAEKQHTARYGAILEMSYAVIDKESHFDRYAVGDAGEVGLMQVKYPSMLHRHERDFKALHAQLAKTSHSADLETRFAAAKKQAIRKIHPELFEVSRNINDGIRYLVDCDIRTGIRLGLVHKADRLSRAEERAWWQGTVASYNRGIHAVDECFAKDGKYPPKAIPYIAAIGRSLQLLRASHAPNVFAD